MRTSIILGSMIIARAVNPAFGEPIFQWIMIGIILVSAGLWDHREENKKGD